MIVFDQIINSKEPSLDGSFFFHTI